MDSLAPVYQALVAHLDALLDAGGRPNAAPVLLDPVLFDQAELELDRHDKAPLALLLLPKIVAVLRLDPPVRLAPPAAAAAASAHAARQPADVLASLATRLLAPAAFADLLRLAPEAALVEALGPDAAPATNLLAMAVVHKAAARSSPGGGVDPLVQLAAMDGLLTALVVRWLASPDVAVGERGLAVLGDLLDVDCPRAPPLPVRAPEDTTSSSNGGPQPEPMPPRLRTRAGPGLLWTKFAGDPPPTAATLAAVAAGPASTRDSDDDDDDTTRAGPLVRLVVRLCRGRHPATAGQPRQQSLAADRLLRLLPRLAALDLRRVAGGDAGDGGLLLCAARDLVALDGPARDELLVRARDHYFAALVDALWRGVIVGTTGAPAEDATYATAVLRTVLATTTHGLAADAPLALHLRALPATVPPALADLAQAWLDVVLPGGPAPGGAGGGAVTAAAQREQTFQRLLLEHRRRRPTAVAGGLPVNGERPGRPGQ